MYGNTGEMRFNGTAVGVCDMMALSMPLGNCNLGSVYNGMLATDCGMFLLHNGSLSAVRSVVGYEIGSGNIAYAERIDRL